jgi:hypothetical protein
MYECEIFIHSALEIPLKKLGAEVKPEVKQKVPLNMYLQVHLFQDTVSFCFMQLDLGRGAQKN